MKANGKTVKEILTSLPLDRAEPFNKLHDIILKNLPKGFEPAISYGGLGYVVPLTLFPAGYHCKPNEPLPFAGIASQKNSINFYHMGIYADPELLKWFVTEYPKHSKQKLDMGKSCVRFKKLDEIPYKLIGELMKKISVKKWINVYETTLKKTHNTKTIKMVDKKSKLAEIKTKQTTASAAGFISTVKDEQKRKDSLVLLAMMKKATGEDGKMWGSSIIGFGSKRYKSPTSGREVDWFLIGFSPRKANLSLYLMINHKENEDAIKKLGKHKTAGGCIYVNKLEDIDLKVLSGIIDASLKQNK